MSSKEDLPYVEQLQEILQELEDLNPEDLCEDDLRYAKELGLTPKAFIQQTIEDVKSIKETDTL